MKLQMNAKCKVWLALLKHLNEIKDDRNHATMVRNKTREKNLVEKAVTVNPIMDKILPDE